METVKPHQEPRPWAPCPSSARAVLIPSALHTELPDFIQTNSSQEKLEELETTILGSSTSSRKSKGWVSSLNTITSSLWVRDQSLLLPSILKQERLNNSRISCASQLARAKKPTRFDENPVHKWTWLMAQPPWIKVWIKLSLLPWQQIRDLSPGRVWQSLLDACVQCLQEYLTLGRKR